MNKNYKTIKMFEEYLCYYCIIIYVIMLSLYNTYQYTTLEHRIFDCV